jgi:hypothetical protein
VRTISFITLCGLCIAAVHAVAADTFIVKDGHPCSEIVIADEPPRATRLAAQELQTYVEKISGAKLSIITEPSGNVPVRVFVGRSSHTDKLGITDEGLKYGAYRIVSGDDWLVFIGDDTDFTPIEPWPRGYQDIRSGKMQRAWNAITGKHWGYTHSQLHKHYTGPNLPGHLRSKLLHDGHFRPCRVVFVEITDGLEELGATLVVEVFARETLWLLAESLAYIVEESLCAGLEIQKNGSQRFVLHCMCPFGQSSPATAVGEDSDTPSSRHD